MNALAMRVFISACRIRVWLSLNEKGPAYDGAFLNFFGDTQINVRGLCPSLPALAGFRKYALVEGTAVSIPAYPHIRSMGCSL